MRSVMDFNLSTRAARQRLEPRHKPYWHDLGNGIHIGYWRGAAKTSWLGRVGIGVPIRYVTEKRGEADDVPDRPGTISYADACDRVRVWANEQREQARLVALGDDPVPESYSVRDSIEDYLADARGRGVKSLKATIEPALRAHVLASPLADIPLRDLTKKRLQNWHHAIAQSAPRRRTSKLALVQRMGPAPQTEEQQRARKSTANFVRNAFFAALNFAFNEGKVKSDAAWRRVKAFKNVGEARIRFITVAETKALLRAFDDDMRRLAAAALLTGARYGELARMTVSDYDAIACTIYVRPGKSGKGRHIHLTPEGIKFFASQTRGKRRDQMMFLRADGGQWRKNHQSRPMKQACAAAGIEPAISFHILRHSNASLMAQAGAPMHIIKEQLGHHSVRVTEKFYAHLSPTSIRDQVRATLPAFGISGKSK
jgi:integrase